MSRNSYDDMLPEGYRGGRRGSGRTTAVIACIGVLLTLMAIFIYLLFSPSGEGDEPEAHRVDPVAAAPAEVSIIETDQDAALIEARPAPSVIEKASEDMAKATQQGPSAQDPNGPQNPQGPQGGQSGPGPDFGN